MLHAKILFVVLGNDIPADAHTFYVLNPNVVSDNIFATFVYLKLLRIRIKIDKFELMQVNHISKSIST